eukprot:4814133-Prymnesium_polylepis.1
MQRARALPCRGRIPSHASDTNAERSRVRRPWCGHQPHALAATSPTRAALAPAVPRLLWHREHPRRHDVRRPDGRRRQGRMPGGLWRAALQCADRLHAGARSTRRRGPRGCVSAQAPIRSDNPACGSRG